MVGLSKGAAMKVLMVGVGPERIGGMWTVAECYIKSKAFNDKVDLEYIPTSTGGSAAKRVLCMLQGYRKIYQRLKQKDIDVVHIHMAEKGSTFRKGYVAKMAKKFGAKVIVQMHAGPFMAWYGTLKSTQQKKIRDIFMIPDRFFVLGNYWMREMAEIVPQEKLDVLYNGISIPETNLYREESRNITFFGLFKKGKGVYDLIDAVGLIDDALDPNVKVQLCGADVEVNTEEYIEERNLSHRVQLMGWCDAKKRDEILRDAAVSVLPSYFEGLSMTVMEAMSYGIPMLTTDISTMPEMLGDEITLIKPGDIQGLADNLLKLMKDPAMRKKWSDIEYARAREYFSLEKNIEKTYNTYCELTSH